MADFCTCNTVEPGVTPRALDGWAAGLDVDVDVEAGVDGEVPDDDPDDPPHAVSSKASEPIPAAAANPLLRITTPFEGSVFLRVPQGPPGSFRGGPGPNTPETYQTGGRFVGVLAGT